MLRLPGETPCVEFPHTLSQILNAVAQAGLHLERAVEACMESEGALSRLPSHTALPCRKSARIA